MDDKAREEARDRPYEKPQAEDLPTAESPSVTAAGETGPLPFGE